MNIIPSSNDPNYNGFMHKPCCIFDINTNIKLCKCTENDKNQVLKQKLCTYINCLYPNKYNFSNKQQKHKLEDILEDILYIANTGVSYRNLRSKINYNTIYYHVNFFTTNNTFKLFYNFLLHEYFKTNKVEKLKYQSIDSSFIINKGAKRDQVKRNVCVKGKNCLKLSLIVETYGIPISVVLETGNVHDAKIFNKNITSFMYEPDTLKCSINEKSQQYFLADAGYDSKFIRESLINNGYKVLIPKNKRNTKHIQVGSNNDYNEKKIYKKRIIVENMFSTIKQHRRLNNIYEKHVESYNMYLYLVLCKILVNKQNQKQK
jgi:hypothetical protein